MNMTTMELSKMKERIVLLETEVRKLRPTESASASKILPQEYLKTMMEEILRTLRSKYLGKHSEEVNEKVVNKAEQVKETQPKKN